MWRLPIIVLLWLWFPAVASAQLRVEVTGVPAFTPPADTLFLTGSFNDWQPADERFLLQRLPAGGYAYDFLTPMPDFTFKVTRGSWASVEGGERAEPIPNRSYRSNGHLRDTLRLAVQSWEDLEQYLPALDTLELRLGSLPSSTPEGAALFATGSFNGWSPRDTAYRFVPNAAGQLTTRIPLRDSLTEFKITRGSWTAIESRRSGLARPNRSFALPDGASRPVMTLAIENWEDLAGGSLGVYGTILLISCVQLLLLALVLFSLRAVNSLANYLLGGLLLLIGLCIGARLAAFDKAIFSAFPKLILVPDLLYFSIGPLAYLFLRSWTDEHFRLRWSHLLYFLPLVAAAAFYAPLLAEDDFDLMTRIVDRSLQLRFAIMAGIGFVVTAYFGYRTLRLLLPWRRVRVRSRFARMLSAAFLLPFAVWSLNWLVAAYNRVDPRETNPTNDLLSDLSWVLVGAVVYPVAYYLLRYPYLFRRRPEETESATEPPTRPEQPTSTTRTTIAATTDSPPAADDLRRLMETKHPYHDPRLTLAALADHAGIPAHQLSRLLNEGFGENFFDFVNGYRVRAFQKRIARGDHRERTLLSLALEAGFNSKTAFNRAFKKHTGLTPRQYLQTVDNQP